jgi:hypothetical protein
MAVKTATRSSRAAGPSVLRCAARLASTGTTASGVRVPIPAAVARELGTLETVEGTINEHPFRAALERDENGAPFVRVNRAMLRGSSARAGDTVLLALLGPEPKLVLAADVRAAMQASPAATALWNDLTDIARRDYVRWVDATKDPQTRARRIRRTVEQLAEGKRRPCCFNAYEYPLSFIAPDWRNGRTKR